MGMGRIGLEVAKSLSHSGVKSCTNSRSQKSFVSYPYYPHLCDDSAESDAIVIRCGLTHQTRHMINKPVMTALGKEGVIVNVGHRGVINEKELVQCLVEGEIGGAGLDVFENQPDVPEELFTIGNVVLSPHRAVHASVFYCLKCQSKDW